MAAASRLFSQLRRRPRPFPSAHHRSDLSLPSSPPPPPTPFLRRIRQSPRIPNWPPCSFLHHPRSFCSSSFVSSRDSEHGETSEGAESEVSEMGLLPGGSEVVGGDDSFLPVRAVISMLDGFHDFTGLPWWIVIASSTLAFRVVLFPVLILQLNKLTRISKLLPKLPPPLPPPLSGRSYIDQISLFLKEQQAVGCPSYLWFLAYFSVQVPCFILWMMSIRKMSLDHHAGFDFGGALWFQNLSEFPHGFSGLVFPTLIAGLHYTNIQLSFRKTSVGKETGLLSVMGKFYKIYLDLLTLPVFFMGFCVPQGSLIFWTTNATLTAIQQLSLNNPVVRKKLGLPDKRNSTEASNPTDIISAETGPMDPSASQGKISVQNLSPQELLALSVKLLAKGQKDGPISWLQLALDKDPEYVRALIVLGQTLLQKGQLVDASEYLERAISKLNHVGDSMEVEDVDLLILASQWAGVACTRQGKKSEGIIHLQRIANLKEPEDLTSKGHYFDGLLLLSSALYNEGHKAEAAKFLRMLVSYNPAYEELLEQCENDQDTSASDLVSSRRGDC